MRMLCGLDLHRGQITFDAVEVESGVEWRGRLWQPDRARFRRWLHDELGTRAAGGSVEIAVEGCTGWRFVVEEIEAAGFVAHVAEPADTQAARGRKQRAKTDRSDARLLRDLLARDELPESWIPPMVVLEWRERVRLYKTLTEQRSAWAQRIHAELYQHGVAVPEGRIRSIETRDWLLGSDVELSPAGRQRISGWVPDDGGHRHRSAPAPPADPPVRAAPSGLSSLGRRPLWNRPVHRGGGVVRVRRLSTVLSIDASGSSHRAGSDRGCLRPAAQLWVLVVSTPQTLRWALFEAGMAASKATSPDRDYYRSVKAAHDGKLAAISMARKLARRCYHTLRDLDPGEVYAVPAGY